jgi:hypothetical protein
VPPAGAPPTELSSTRGGAVQLARIRTPFFQHVSAAALHTEECGVDESGKQRGALAFAFAEALGWADAARVLVGALYAWALGLARVIGPAQCRPLTRARTIPCCASTSRTSCPP